MQSPRDYCHRPPRCPDTALILMADPRMVLREVTLEAQTRFREENAKLLPWQNRL